MISDIATIELLFVAPSHGYPQVPPGCRGVRVTLRLGQPEGGPYPGECWIHLDGWEKPVKVCGVDHWQALFLAVRTMRHTLQVLENEGWRFEYYEEGSEKIDFDDCGPFMSVKEIFSERSTSQ